MRLLLLSISLLILISCTENTTGNDQSTTSNETTKKDSFWKGSKTFSHPQDSTFEIWVRNKNNGYLLELKFAPLSDFQSDILKTKETLEEMESNISLEQIELVDISIMNHKVFFAEIVKIKAIEENIIENEKENKKWVNFAVVENNIHQSQLLGKFTALFQKYGLMPEQYSIQKCTFRRNKDQQYEMSCPELLIKMKKRIPK